MTSLEEGLLVGAAPRPWLGVLRVFGVSPPLVLLLSSIGASCAGTLLLKHSQLHASTGALCAGYALESVGFLMYPLLMRFYSLPTIVVTWSLCSSLTAVVGSWAAFGDAPRPLAVAGCAFNLVGVVLVSGG